MVHRYSNSQTNLTRYGVEMAMTPSRTVPEEMCYENDTTSMQRYRSKQRPKSKPKPKQAQHHEHNHAFDHHDYSPYETVPSSAYRDVHQRPSSLSHMERLTRYGVEIEIERDDSYGSSHSSRKKSRSRARSTSISRSRSGSGSKSKSRSPTGAGVLVYDPHAADSMPYVYSASTSLVSEGARVPSNEDVRDDVSDHGHSHDRVFHERRSIHEDTRPKIEQTSDAVSSSNLGFFHQLGLCAPPSVLLGFCASQAVPPDPVALSFSMGRDDDKRESKEGKKPPLSPTICQTASRLITCNTSTSVLRGEALVRSSDSDVYERTHPDREDSAHISRDSFSLMSPSFPGVGWPVVVDSNGRVTKRRNNAFSGNEAIGRTQPFKVAIIDDRISDMPLPPVNQVEVMRDPGLLARSHFTGWDGKRSHYTVSAPPKKEEEEEEPEEEGSIYEGSVLSVTEKLRPIPGTFLQYAAPFMPTPVEHRGPKWQHPEILRQLEGADVVLHLVTSKGHRRESNADTNTTDESSVDGHDKDDKKQSHGLIGLSETIEDIIAASFNFGSDDEEESFDEDSYSPSTTIGINEHRLIHNFLGSDSDSDAGSDPGSFSVKGLGDTPYASEMFSTRSTNASSSKECGSARDCGSPRSASISKGSANKPQSRSGDGRPPLISNSKRDHPLFTQAKRSKASMNPPAYIRNRSEASNSSRVSSGSKHRRQNSTIFFSSSDPTVRSNRNPESSKAKGKSPRMIVKTCGYSHCQKSKSVGAKTIAPGSPDSTGKGMRKGENGKNASNRLKTMKSKLKSASKFWRQHQSGQQDCDCESLDDETIRSDMSQDELQQPHTFTHQDHLTVAPSFVASSALAPSPPLEIRLDAYLVTSPLFRRALRTMGRRRNHFVRPVFESWVAFSKGDRLIRRLRNSDEHEQKSGLSKSDLRYVILIDDGSPTLHIFHSSREGGETKVDSVEHLALRPHMRVETLDIGDKYGRGIAIIDGRNEKIVGTIVPVLLKAEMFADNAKTCLVSDTKNEDVGGELTFSLTIDEIFPDVDDHHAEANDSSLALSKSNTELRRGPSLSRKLTRSKSSNALSRQVSNAEWGDPLHWTKFAPEAQYDASNYLLYSLDLALRV